MQRPKLWYYVQDNSNNPFLEGGAYIPTLGHIATAVDWFCLHSIGYIENPSKSWAFTDVESASALGRLIDGPIRSRRDIEGAESALRALLLHEVVDVVIPTVKFLDGGLKSYARFDREIRNQAAFEAFQVADCADYLIACEAVEIKDGQVTASSRMDSELVGRPITDGDKNYSLMLRGAANVASALPMQLNAATYYTSPDLIQPMKNGAKDFIDQLYRKIENPWVNVAQSQPAFSIDVRLPPLISIVLSRAPSRSSIPSVLKELRDELRPIRLDLVQLNELLDRTMTQADLAAQVRRINQSFDAIVPEALLTDAQRRLRPWLCVFRIVSWVRQALESPLSPSVIDEIDRMTRVFDASVRGVRYNRSITTRSVTAAKFSELLRMESVRGLITSHFTRAEIEVLNRDAL